MKTLKFFAPLLLMLVLSASAQNTNTESKRIHQAVTVLKEFSRMKESIPHELISQYQGIVIIPHMINAGLGIGGKRGKGIAIVKLDNGNWSDPVFITLTGGSVGPQIGIESVDLVLVFRHKGVLTRVKDGDFTIGGDISAAAGPVGRSTSANTDYALQAEVYSYSRSRGLFAGISINGSDLAFDKDANQSFYGDGMSSSQIFADGVSNNPDVKLLKNTLAGM